MKKIFGLTLILMFALLTACSPSDKTDNSSTSESTTSTTRTESSASSETSSSTSSSTESSSEPVTSTEPSIVDPNAPNAQNELLGRHTELRMPRVTVPSGKYLNVSSLLEVNHLRILYYEMDTPLPLDDAQLDGQTPFASYDIRSFGTEDEANTAVNYVVDTTGQQVDLGHNITGFQQGAAGSTYLNWQEGSWGLTVRSSTADGEKIVSTAKEMVTYLENNSLPVPKTVGQVTMDLTATGLESSQVAWQVEESVYKVTSEDPLKALEIAASVK